MNKNIERDLVNFLYFELNKENFLLKDQIFEYDVQAKVHEFLIRKFQNTNHKVKREKYLIDHVVENCDEKGILINQTFIELKTFIKSSERLSYRKIEDDISKLNKSFNLTDEYYFLLVVKNNHLTNKSPRYQNLIKCVNDRSIKKYAFEIGQKKIKTRIIRSLSTSYNEVVRVENGEIIKFDQKFHKNQIRVFLFQLN